MDITSKVCSKCGETKTLDKFHFKSDKSRNPLKRDGKCKKCRSAWANRNYVPRPRKVANPSAWKTNCPIHRMWANAKARAKQQGIPFSITEEDIKIPEMCPVLGLKLEPGTGQMGPNSPSLDKLIPSLGYVPGNITVISIRANTIKHDATSEEILKVGQWVASKGA